MAVRKEIVSMEKELCSLLGCNSYTVNRHACRGAYRGHYDYSITFQNGYNVFVGVDRNGYESKLPEVLERFRNFFAHMAENSDKVNSAAVSCGFRSASVEIVPQFDNTMVVWACVSLIDKYGNKWLYRCTDMHYALTGGVYDYEIWGVEYQCSAMVKSWVENSDLFQIVEVAPVLASRTEEVDGVEIIETIEIVKGNKPAPVGLE